jgi:hypothetical protein
MSPIGRLRGHFPESTGADLLRDTEFVVLREDKDPRKFVKKGAF